MFPSLLSPSVKNSTKRKRKREYLPQAQFWEREREREREREVLVKRLTREYSVYLKLSWERSNYAFQLLDTHGLHFHDPISAVLPDLQPFLQPVVHLCPPIHFLMPIPKLLHNFPWWWSWVMTQHQTTVRHTPSLFSAIYTPECFSTNNALQQASIQSACGGKTSTIFRWKHNRRSRTQNQTSLDSFSPYLKM